MRFDRQSIIVAGAKQARGDQRAGSEGHDRGAGSGRRLHCVHGDRRRSGEAVLLNVPTSYGAPSLDSWGESPAALSTMVGARGKARVAGGT